MKLPVWILALGFLYATKASAQAVENEKPVSNSNLKGYYSIGNNRTKLNSTVLPATTSIDTTIINKGFYSINKNRNKLSRRVLVVDVSNQKPDKRNLKGYYSIGRNAEKL